MTAAARELTGRSIALGIALALILGAANAYLGLYAGLTVSASIPAAVISMAMLRILGGSTILENNVVQTIASAGEAVAAGAIFTFPALVILGGVKTLPYVEVTALCVVGATMGSLLVVFIRRAYIVEERLPYPEGMACAQVLRAGAEQANVRPLVAGGLISAALKALQDLAGIIPGAVSGARWVGSAAVAGSIDISAALLGVGYIIGVRIAALVFAGGAFAWIVAIPALTAFHSARGTGDAAATASQLWSGQVRYLGVGAMLTGGLVTLWRLRSRIAAAIADSIRIVRSTQALSGNGARGHRSFGARGADRGGALRSGYLRHLRGAERASRAQRGAGNYPDDGLFFRDGDRRLSDRNSRRVEQSGFGRDGDCIAGGGAVSEIGRRVAKRRTATGDSFGRDRVHGGGDGG